MLVLVAALSVMMLARMLCDEVLSRLGGDGWRGAGVICRCAGHYAYRVMVARVVTACRAVETCTVGLVEVWLLVYFVHAIFKHVAAFMHACLAAEQVGMERPAQDALLLRVGQLSLVICHPRCFGLPTGPFHCPAFARSHKHRHALSP